MISYAQNFEDVILERFFKEKFDGFYVDIGAAWATTHSVTRHFYDKGWHGINVEPASRFYKELCEERTRDINLNLVISNEEGNVDFFELENTGLSTLIKGNAEQANNNENVFDSVGVKPPLRNVSVVSRRLETIFNEYSKGIEIDFLKIDVEGAEEDVIKSNNWEVFRPKVLIIEATLPLSTVTYYEHWEKILLDVHYSFVFFDGLNRYYLRNDLLEHKAKFSYPACVFDDFITYSEYIKKDELDAVVTRLNEIEVRYNELDSFVKTLLNSTYWKITKPVRVVFKLIGIGV